MTQDHEGAAAALFELVLGRCPRQGEETELLAGHVGQALDRRLVSELLGYRHARRADVHRRLAELSHAPLAKALQRTDCLDRECYEAAYEAILHGEQPLIIGQNEYLPQHKERFWELLNACSRLLDGRPSPRLLEFGASEFSRLYKQMLGDIELHLSDRPTPPGYIGFTEEVAFGKLGCDAYFSVDLEEISTLWEGIEVGAGYDLILFAEVLEHLVVNPIELLRGLLRLLKPNGLLYLTTPNLFRAECRDQWLALENPQAVFPATGGNWDRHHHYREYGAAELFRFVAEAGGQVAAFYYSSCWDLEPGPIPDERGNLVLVIGPIHAR